MEFVDVPCVTCEQKGCGAYHDECPAYQKYRAFKDEQARERKLKGESKASWISKSTFRDRGKNSPFRCHKR